MGRSFRLPNKTERTFPIVTVTASTAADHQRWPRCCTAEPPCGKTGSSRLLLSEKNFCDFVKSILVENSVDKKRSHEHSGEMRIAIDANERRLYNAARPFLRTLQCLWFREVHSVFCRCSHSSVLGTHFTACPADFRLREVDGQWCPFYR